MRAVIFYVLLFVADIYAALTAYMSAIGQKSGTIKGSVITQGKQGLIQLISAQNAIAVPLDPQSGHPTGKLHTGVYTVTKYADKSSPALYNVLATNENLSQVSIQFWGPSSNLAGGQPAEVWTVTLTNANIESIVESFSTDSNSVTNIVQTISFTFQKITWTWVDGGLTASASAQ